VSIDRQSTPNPKRTETSPLPFRYSTSTTDDRRPTTDDRRPTTDDRRAIPGVRVNVVGYSYVLDAHRSPGASGHDAMPSAHRRRE